MTKSSRKVGFTGSASLIVANMVGTGIFTSLGFQLEGIESVTPIMLLWFIGGLTAFLGAVSYGQLIKYFPDSGGETYFVSQLYGKKASYLTGIITLIFGFAAPIALSALAFADYLYQNTASDGRILATSVVIVISIVHSFNITISTIFQSATSIIKIFVLIIFICAGLYIGNQSGVLIKPKAKDMESIFSMPFMLSFMYVHYAYSGWNASIYIFREIKQDTTLYRSLFLSVTLVTILYMLLNFVFLTSSGVEQLKGVIDVGKVAANNIFGNNLGKAFSLIIAFLLVSGISAMIWAGSRVSMKLEELFNGIISNHEIPRKHIIIQMVISIVFIWTARFQTILTITTVILSLCSVAVVTGIFIHSTRLGVTKTLTFSTKICAIFYCLIIGICNLCLLYFAVIK